MEDTNDPWYILLQSMAGQIQALSNKVDSGAFVNRNEWNERKRYTDTQLEQIRQDTKDDLDGFRKESRRQTDELKKLIAEQKPPAMAGWTKVNTVFAVATSVLLVLVTVINDWLVQH